MPFVAGQKIRAQELNDLAVFEPDAAFDNSTTFHQTTSTTFTNIDAGLSVTVDVESSGIALVSICADTTFDGDDSVYVDFAVSGANSRSASELTALFASPTPTAETWTLCRTIVLTGLTQGSTTFTPQWRRLGVGSTGAIDGASIAVVTY